MILELDLGNSRWKWRMQGPGGAITARGVLDSASSLAGELPAAWGPAIRRIKIASVLAPATEAALVAVLSARLSATVEFARAAARCAGVRNAYTDPGRLGVDRWLAMIAAYRELQGPVLVVDIGSALTVDLVDATGQHLGGYIVPGPRLMAESLQQSTDQVRFDASEAPDQLGFGRSTAVCVHNGIAAALAGLVMVARQNAERELNGRAALVVAGGYGELLAAHLAQLGIDGCLLRSELVMDGLSLALP